MEIIKIFEDYTSKTAQLHLYQRAIKENSKRELQNLEKYSKAIEENPFLKEHSSSLHNMFFYDAKNGEIRLFAHKKITLEETRNAVFIHKNKQYQWLLVEAYEEFMIFIEGAYAFAGYTDKNIWPLADFGNINLAELENKKIDWFFSQVKNKKEKPQSIFNRFKKVFPEIEKLEVSNGVKINFRFVIVLIEHLRHIIVHKGGVVSDKNKFIDDVLKKSGLHNNGKPDVKDVDFINSFFGKAVAYQNTVVLLEVRIHQNEPIDFHINIFDMLSGYLVSYAYMVLEILVSHVNNSKNT